MLNDTQYKLEGSQFDRICSVSAFQIKPDCAYINALIALTRERARERERERERERVCHMAAHMVYPRAPSRTYDFFFCQLLSFMAFDSFLCGIVGQ